MKISLRWIEELLGHPLELSAQEFKSVLLNLGFESGSIENYPKCSGVFLGEILNIKPHPNADRLRIVEVTDSKETLELVCGAPNLQIAQRVLWAKEGAVLADGKTLRKAVIRGVSSEGMLLSCAELEVGIDHSGLWIFTEKAPLGTPLEELVSLEDTLIDIEVTPNRPDCLSHMGIAREIAAALNLKTPQLKDCTEPLSRIASYTVIIEDPKTCSHYIARKLENVRVLPSPLQMQTRLARCGVRPINNLVDITNTILLELGQPLHVFDADRLEGEKIIVRRASSKEKILALDGKTYELDPDILVIADEKKPVALAGVMGDKATAVTPQTKNVLLESALFHRAAIRKTRLKLGLSSESSTRFEKGVTSWSCEMGSWKASQSIANLAQGNQVSGLNLHPNSNNPKACSIRVSQLNKILGLELTPEEISSQLHKLTISILHKDAAKIEILSPEWRVDLNSEIDFIEEVARMKGYANIPSKGEKATLSSEPSALNESLFLRRAKSALISLGFYECINSGFIASKECQTSEGSDFRIEIENPLSKEQSILRPSLIFELFKNLKTNVSYQNKEAKLFETGTVFRNQKGNMIERTYLAGLAYGFAQQPYWQNKQGEKIGFYWLKGIMETFFKSLSLPSMEWHPLIQELIFPYPFVSLNPHTAFELRLPHRKERCGWVGLLHPKTAKEEKLNDGCALFELDLELLKESAQTDKKIKPIRRTPRIYRDCSLWVPEVIPWIQIEAEIYKAGGTLLEHCALFDLYRDKTQSSLKSVSFSLTFRDPEKTLSDETANHCVEKIAAHLGQKFKAELRSK